MMSHVVCRQAPVITHMLFADDCYIYCKAKEEEAGKMLELLNVYEKTIGQKVNAKKLSVFFSINITNHTRVRISETLGMIEAHGNTKYFGLPSILGKNKTSLLRNLKDKVMKRVQSWDGRWISKGGKEISIKNVAQTLPNLQ